MMSFQTFIARALAFILVIVAVHWINRFIPFYFLTIATIGLVMLISLFKPIPYLGCLATLNTNDRLAIWIVIVVLGIIGYLHNANSWINDGHFNRPDDISLWKSELILGISLATTLAHWLAGVLLPSVVTMDGRQFATEFALYVNFSGIALLLWSGEAALSLYTLSSAITLMVLVELTLYASREAKN
jgi:hypothetical protein